MKIRDSKQEDYEYMRDNTISRGILDKQPGCIDFCYTIEHEDKILCIGGFRLINTVTMWCWLDMSPEAGNHIIALYRVIKDYLNVFAKDEGIKRAQAYVEPDFPEAIRMVQHLGFHKESIMEGFTPKGDAFLYRRLF